MALRNRLPDRITNFPLKYQILLCIPTDAKCIYFNILVAKQDIIRLATLPYYNFHKGVIVKFTINFFGLIYLNCQKQNKMLSYGKVDPGNSWQMDQQINRGTEARHKLLGRECLEISHVLVFTWVRILNFWELLAASAFNFALLLLNRPTTVNLNPTSATCPTLALPPVVKY
jgi:hypothetical protein